MSIRIAELERMVFGRKRDKDKTPPDEAVTGEEYVPVSECGHCHGPLTNLEDYIRYIEDIVLAALADTRLKTVTKLTIQRGWCTWYRERENFFPAMRALASR